MKAAVKTLVFLLVAGAVVFLVRAYLLSREVGERSRITCLRGLHVDYVLTQLEFGRLGRLDPDFDITPDGAALVGSREALWAINPNPGSRAGVAPLDLRGRVPQSFALDDNANLLTITDGYLGVCDENGQATLSIPLPYDNERIAHSVDDGVFYIFGGAGSDYRAYRFSRDGTYVVLLKSGDPIVGITEGPEGIYAATPGMVFRLAGNAPVEVFKAPDDPAWGPIISIAASTDPGLVFLSTPTSVYAVSKGIAVTLVADSGGTLDVRNDKLYILDRARQLLVALSPETHAMFSQP